MSLEQRTVPRHVAILHSGRRVEKRMKEVSFGAIPENLEVHSRVEQYPELLDGDRRVRFDPFSGELWVATYREPKRGRQLEFNKGDLVHRRGAYEGDPQVVRFLRWSKYQDIEAAIRGMAHVAEDKYGKKEGSEVRKIRAATALMRDLLQEFREGDLTRERLEALHRTTANRLAEVGFDRVEKSIRQRLADQINLAAQTDILDRPNDLVSRSRIASAWLKAIEELLFAKLVREKFPYLKDGLFAERDIERFYLEQGIRGVDTVLRLGEQHKEIVRGMLSLLAFCKTYFASGRVRANPYRGPALIAYASLFSIDTREKNERNMLSGYCNEVVLDQIMAKPTIMAVYLDEKRSLMSRWEEIAQRLGNARDILSRALGEGEENLNKNGSQAQNPPSVS